MSSSSLYGEGRAPRRGAQRAAARRWVETARGCAAAVSLEVQEVGALLAEHLKRLQLVDRHRLLSAQRWRVR